MMHAHMLMSWQKNMDIHLSIPSMIRTIDLPAAGCRAAGSLRGHCARSLACNLAVSVDVGRSRWVAHVVATAMETSRPLIDRNGHTLKVELAEEKLVVNGDRDRLVQVVANLLTNAAKYTPPGGMVDVVVKRKGEEVSIVVKDNGIGIAAEKISSVFDMFTQVDPHQKTESGGGLGIGLNIVQRIMEMHNGAVEARSEGLGKGSEFSLRIPRLLGKVVQPAPTKPTTEQGGTRRVMVVDDNEDAADIIADIDQALGK